MLIRTYLKIVCNIPFVMIDEPVQLQQFNWISLGFKLIVLVKHNIGALHIKTILYEFIYFYYFLFRKYVFFQTTKQRVFSKKRIFTKLMHF